MQPGLTMIVGPPGTGKTDVAVQIISNIYHNFPNERTCIVTHSNQGPFFIDTDKRSRNRHIRSV